MGGAGVGSFCGKNGGEFLIFWVIIFCGKKTIWGKMGIIFDFGWIFFGEEIGVDILGKFFGEENVGEILFDTDSLPPFRWQALEKVPDDGDGSRDSQLGGRYRVINENYFTSSDPHHDMLGGGCQVRVVIKNMMGRMENLRALISGFLGLVILVRWALVTIFLS